MRVAVLLTALLMANLARAAILTWPGPAPCDASLGNCIFNADPSDTIRIATNTVDTGATIINKSLTLEAAPGYLPRFAEDERVIINFTDSADHSVTIRGLQFARGQIQAVHQGGDGEVLIERNRFETSMNNEPSIWLSSSAETSGADFDYTVRYNTIDDSTQNLGAIRVQATGSGNGWIRGTIEGNHLVVKGSGSRGISVIEYDSSPHQTRVLGNTIEGAHSKGIDFFNGEDGGSMLVHVYSNLVYHTDSQDRTGEAISLWSSGGPINAWVVNNSMIGHRYGLAVREDPGGNTEATVANNIIARNAIAWLVHSGATFSEHHNLFHANSDEPGSIDGTSIMADPLFHPNLPGRLRAGSPAIDAGDNAATSTLPGLDARGHARYVNGVTDIGAVEFGDRWLVARKPTAAGNNFVVDSPFLNSQPGQYPQVTSLWNPYGRGGIYNDANEGIYYAGEVWRIFNESISAQIPQGAAFWVYAPGISLLTHSHSNTTAASSTQVDSGAANDHPERILAVTQHWNRFGSGVYNNHPIGVFYFSGHWRIANLDLADIPIGADFNLYVQDPSQNAFEHIARGANISGNYTRLRHPLLDGNPCARMQVTQSASQGVFNAHPIGVWYTDTHWAIFNQDLANMPEDAAFHVIVDGDSQGCELFSDRFQGGGF